MKKNIVYDVLKINKNERLFIILKNGFKYEGRLLDFDENFLSLDDKKIGVIAISLSDIMNVRRSFR